MSETEAAAQPMSDSPEAMKAFREIWPMAVDGRLGENLDEAISAALGVSFPLG
jgi:hypothetical protein